MSTSTAAKREAFYKEGKIILRIEGAVELSFPVSGNPRLEKATPEQLGKIEVSPFGLHWPDLDEDLSFEGLRRGDYGQRKRA